MLSHCRVFELAGLALAIMVFSSACTAEVLGCGGQPGLAASGGSGGTRARHDGAAWAASSTGSVEVALAALVKEALRDDRNMPTPEPPLKFASGIAPETARTNDSWRLSQPEAAEELMSKLAGLHEPSCRGDADARRVAVVRADIDQQADGSELIAGSFADGVVVLDAAGNVVARGNPLGDCFGSPTLLESITGVQLIDDPERELVMVTDEGRRGISFRTLSIFKRRGKRLARIFSGMVGDSQEKAAGSVEITGPGRLVFRGPGPVRPRSFEWDADSFILVEK